MSVNSKMTAIGDVIRAKTGGTAALTLDQMAEAIASISVGNNAVFATGEYTPSADASAAVSIDHGLGTTPNYFLIVAEGDVNTVDMNKYLVAYAGFLKKLQGGTTATYGGGYFRCSGSSTSAAAFTAAGAVGTAASVATATQFTIAYNINYKLKSGVTYRWIAGYADGIT